jgi:hypothetical protein
MTKLTVAIRNSTNAPIKTTPFEQSDNQRAFSDPELQKICAEGSYAFWHKESWTDGPPFNPAVPRPHSI